MSPYTRPTGWFAANRAEDEETDDRYPWQPILQDEGGQFPLPVWFATEAECTDFITREVLGRGLLGDS